MSQHKKANRNLNLGKTLRKRNLRKWKHTGKYVLNDKERIHVDEATTDYLTLDLEWDVIHDRPDDEYMPTSGNFADLVECFLTNDWLLHCVLCTNRQQMG